MQETWNPSPPSSSFPCARRRAEDIEPILQTLVSLTATAPDAMVLVVDDRSPAPQAQMIEVAAAELDCAYVLQQDGEGRSAAFNVGLAAALEHGMDVVPRRPRPRARVRRLARPPARPHRHRRRARRRRRRRRHRARPALIRQAGYFFSLFRRAWSARLRRVPAGSCSTSHDAAAVPGQLRAAAHPPRVDRDASASTTSCSTARTPRSTTACASARPAASACSSRPCAPARSSSATASPTTPAAAARRLRLKHAGVNFQPWAPEVI